jgi:hypothetical protein
LKALRGWIAGLALAASLGGEPASAFSWTPTVLGDFQGDVNPNGINHSG